MNNDNYNRPKVGVGVIVIKDDFVLLGKRKNSHGNNTWNFPGGHLEFNENIAECAKRETKEETNLEVSNLYYGPYTNDVFINENKHYVTAFVIAHTKKGSLKIMEPDKCEEWRWFKWNQLPETLFLPIKNLIEIGFSPFSWVGFKIQD